MSRIRKSSIGDIPILLPDGKPSRRRLPGAGRPRWPFVLLAIVLVALGVWQWRRVVAARNDARVQRQAAQQAKADSAAAATPKARPDSARRKPR